MASLKVDPDLGGLPSRRNRASLTTNDPVFHEFIGQLVSEAQTQRKRKRKYTKKEMLEFGQNLACVILDTFAAFETSPDLWVGYSRGKNNFVRGGPYWSNEKAAPLLSRSHYINAITLLEGLGLLENHVAPKGFGKNSSRVRAMPELYQELKRRNFTWAKISERLDEDLLIVKNKDGRPIPWPDPGAFNIGSALEQLKRINENLSSTCINLDVSDEELFQLTNPDNSPDQSDDEYEEEPVDFTRRKLRRVFGLGSFTNGGRFYGGWWQNIPSRLRKHIEIDGAMTVELDFATLQPRILYASIGQPLPRDSYLIPSWNPDLRPIVKKAFSQLLNSAPSSRNPNQWHRFAPNMNPDPLPEEWGEMRRHEKDAARRRAFIEATGRDYSELLDDLLRFHEPIKADFFSGVWGATQSLDSEIAGATMTKLLSREVPITALPVHDSFIVRRGAEHELMDTMKEAFNEVVGENSKIDRDEAVFDPPADYVPNGPIWANNELHESTRAHMESHRQYHKREIEWVEAFGPL